MMPASGSTAGPPHSLPPVETRKENGWPIQFKWSELSLTTKSLKFLDGRFMSFECSIGQHVLG
jgi:hypothetical protein